MKDVMNVQSRGTIEGKCTFGALKLALHMSVRQQFVAVKRIANLELSLNLESID